MPGMDHHRPRTWQRVAEQVGFNELAVHLAQNGTRVGGGA